MFAPFVCTGALGGTAGARDDHSLELPARVRDGIVDIAARDVRAFIVSSWYRQPAESGEEVLSVARGILQGSTGSATGTGIVSLALALIALCGLMVVRSK